VLGGLYIRMDLGVLVWGWFVSVYLKRGKEYRDREETH
jgi:hypothetical protein